MRWLKSALTSDNCSTSFEWRSCTLSSSDYSTSRIAGAVPAEVQLVSPLSWAGASLEQAPCNLYVDLANLHDARLTSGHVRQSFNVQAGRISCRSSEFYRSSGAGQDHYLTWSYPAVSGPPRAS